jgi:hypothetical protein
LKNFPDEAFGMSITVVSTHDLERVVAVSRSEDYWTLVAEPRSTNTRHFLFYFKDETFECDAADWDFRVIPGGPDATANWQKDDVLRIHGFSRSLGKRFPSNVAGHPWSQARQIQTLDCDLAIDIPMRTRRERIHTERGRHEK